MPSSVGHYAAAYLIRRLRGSLALPGLVVSSVVPDLDLLINLLAPAGQSVPRGLLHSLLGAAALGTLISVALVVSLYTPVVSWIFGVGRKDAEEACRFSGNLVASCLVGGLSHVLVDSTCHRYNPLFYPFTRRSFDALMVTDDWRTAYATVEGLLLVALSLILLVELRRGTEGFWERLLIR